jgi:hypothetical protein
MKLPILIFASIFAAASVHAETELEGREGLTVMCRQTPENTELFCACLADRAVAVLPREARQQLVVEWWYPSSVFNFKRPLGPNELSDYDEQMWGPWQRESVPACNAISK